jgi:ATP-dependent DNA helicase RecG
VDDNGNFIGVKNAKKLMEDIPNKVRNKLGIIPSVEIKQKENREIVYILVHPSYVPISYNGKYYIRSGSTSLALKGKALDNFIMKKHIKTWDEFIEERASFKDIDLETIEEFKKYSVDRIPSIATEKDYKIILEKLNLLEGNKLKRGSILLFGKNPQKYFINLCVRIGRLKTETIIIDDKWIKGNLFYQFQETLKIIKQYIAVKYEIKEVKRKDIWDYPIPAIREALLNALIHRDYFDLANFIQIKIYDDHIWFSNPGGLPTEITIEELKKPHKSYLKNPLIANVFYLAGYIEQFGSGTIRMVEWMKEKGLPEPEYREEMGGFSVYFYKDIYTEEYLKKLGLNERQIKAVIYVKKKGNINLSAYKNLVEGVSEKTLYRDLQKLVNKRILKETGEKKGRRYELK